MNSKIPYRSILVPTDFSPHSEAALQQAIWLARRTEAKITLVHVLPDLRDAMFSVSSAAQRDMFFGEGEQFQQEIREESKARLQYLISKVGASDLGIQSEVLLGDPAIAIIHAVQQERHDLVIVGTRGLSPWERFVMGSTAKRLIRKCPSPVWTAKSEGNSPPLSVMAATDYSEVSRLAVLAGQQIATEASAQFHIVHVIDSKDIPQGAIERLAPGGTLRGEIYDAAKNRLTDFVKSLGDDWSSIQTHLSWGIPSQEVPRLANQLNIDVLAIGTVGRRGIKGVLLGNTAERVLDTCHCSILAVKPEGFVSPIEPPFWPLHPASQTKSN